MGVVPVTVQFTSSATRRKKGRLSPLSQAAKAVATRSRFSAAPISSPRSDGVARTSFARSRPRRDSAGRATADVGPLQRRRRNAQLPPGRVGDAFAPAVGAGSLHEVVLESCQI